MLKRSLQAGDHFRGGFKESPRFRLVHSFHVITQMLNQFPELAPYIRGMRLGLFGLDRLHQYYFVRRDVESRVCSGRARPMKLMVASSLSIADYEGEPDAFVLNFSTAKHLNFR